MIARVKGWNSNSDNSSREHLATASLTLQDISAHWKCWHTLFLYSFGNYFMTETVKNGKSIHSPTAEAQTSHFPTNSSSSSRGDTKAFPVVAERHNLSSMSGSALQFPPNWTWPKHLCYDTSQSDTQTGRLSTWRNSSSAPSPMQMTAWPYR